MKFLSALLPAMILARGTPSCTKSSDCESNEICPEYDINWEATGFALNILKDRYQNTLFKSYCT